MWGENDDDLQILYAMVAGSRGSKRSNNGRGGERRGRKKKRVAWEITFTDREGEREREREYQSSGKQTPGRACGRRIRPRGERKEIYTAAGKRERTKTTGISGILSQQSDCGLNKKKGDLQFEVSRRVWPCSHADYFQVWGLSIWVAEDAARASRGNTNEWS